MPKLLIPLLMLGLLVGCSVAPPLVPTDTPEQAWQEHRAQMLAVSHWRLNGRLLVVSGHETWNTGLNWQQQGEAYQIMITAPLGQGSMRLVGDPQRVTLESHEGERWFSDHPEQLLAEQLGWRVPVSALRYWVLGLPAPGDYQPTLNEAGLLGGLVQGGWEIEFRDYRERDGVMLPGRIFANNHQARVRLIIGEWRHEPY